MQSLLGKIKRKKSKSNEKREPLIAKEESGMKHENVKEPNVHDQRIQNGHDGEDHEEEASSDHLENSTKSVIQHEQVIAVIVHRTDRIKSKLYISHPTVKIHFINSNTGEYLKKSIIRRPGAYNFEKATVDHLLPLMTKPSNFRSDDTQSFPVWEELLLFNESYGYITKPENQVLIIFEMLDFMSMEALKSQTNVSQVNGEDGASGWYRIAWAFLKVVGGSGEVNIGKKLRLQLYRAPRKTRMKDDQQTEVFHWYKHLPKIKYPGSLYVTVKPTVPPGHVPRVTRSMFAIQPEGAESGTMIGDDKSEEKYNEGVTVHYSILRLNEKLEEIYLWSRLPGQPCKVPNKQILSLASGKLGCFSVQFSTNGRLLACAGCENQRKYPIFIYSIPDGMAKGICFGHVNLVYELKFNLNSDLLLSASADCTARLWDVSTCFCIQTFPHTTFVYCAKFHPANENLIITGCFDKRIRIWQIVESVEGQVIQELETHVGYVNAMCFSIDGLTLYSGDGSGYIRLWDTPPQSAGHWALRKEIKEDELIGKPINNLILHPDQKRLFVQSRDGVIRILDLRAYALRNRFTGLENNRMHVRCTITPCGTFLFAGSETGKVIVWHIQTGKKVTEYDNLRIGDHPITSVAYHLLDHIVTFAVFAEAQLVLVYKYDSSVPDLYKEDSSKLIDVQPAKPSFDPDFSVAKLLEEHKILLKYEMASFPKKAQPGPGKPTVVITGSDDVDDSKPLEPITVSSGKSKMVPSPRRKQVSFKSPSQSPEVVPKGLSLKPEIQVIASKPLIIPSLADEGRQPSMLEKTFSVESQEEDETVNEQEKNEEEQHPDEMKIPDDPAQHESAETVLFTVKAKHKYSAQNQDEISFNSQDIINVVSNEDPNWWVGFVEPQKVGYFPSNYVEQIAQLGTVEEEETDVVEL